MTPSSYGERDGRSVGAGESKGSDIPSKTDVLIVGAGPTGLSLACGLARRGIDHVVIDHAPQPATYSHSTMLDARTLEALETIDANEPIVRRGQKIRHFSMRDGDEHLFQVDYAVLRTRYPFALILPEITVANVLAERLAAFGSPVLRPVTAVGLEQTADDVAVQLWDGSTRSGAPLRRTILARYVVGCDGMRSQIRSALQIPFVGSSHVEAFLMADVRMDWSLPRSDVQLFFSEHGLTVVAPLPDDRYRLLATVDRVVGAPELEDLQRLLAARGPRSDVPRIHDVVWSTCFGVDRSLAMHYRSGRVFLAGDAAHVHTPTEAQGMNAGIQDALYLAEHLGRVIRGHADDRSLDSYERDRRPIAESVFDLTRRMSRIATLRDPRHRRWRNRVLRTMGRIPGLPAALARRISGLEWAHRVGSTPRDNGRLLVVTLALVALLLGAGLVHTQESHAPFAYIVGFVQGAALVASAWLAARRKREERGFAISAMAAFCLLAAFGIWIILMPSGSGPFPAFCPLTDHDPVAAQSREDLSHWGRVVLHLCSFGLLAATRR
jgi:2-polyprenyl-6-methoxyphenol hydroxylase-like FAD-dependent oxidoreductase